jgi:CRISPR/Cas system endoribonuclease Cas6 (RAMP superfamily)
MEQAVRDASMLSGIGDGRSIGFGRFAVEEFFITGGE